MSKEPEPRRRRRPAAGARVRASDPLRNGLPGVALVLASVLPAVLSPSPAGRTATTTTTAPTAEPPVATGRAPSRRRAALAFDPPCELPFADIMTEGLEVDSVCSVDGGAKDGDIKKRLEINAKNNFCADGDPTPITYEDFKSLQAASDAMPGLKQSLKTTRDPLLEVLKRRGRPPLGEGSLVKFVGFVLKAKHSNVGKGKGELVNCKLTDREDNDIHIELSKDGKDDEPCNSVTAEMSPHFRPEAWAELDGLKIERPVRVTGPLFFDGSHAPCRDGVRPHPNRISVWEIHPVYQFEVCKNRSLSGCKANDDSQWIPFDQWQNVDEPEEEES